MHEFDEKLAIFWAGLENVGSHRVEKLMDPFWCPILGFSDFLDLEHQLFDAHAGNLAK